jgi:hypothetical protein
MLLPLVQLPAKCEPQFLHVQLSALHNIVSQLLFSLITMPFPRRINRKGKALVTAAPRQRPVVLQYVLDCDDVMHTVEPRYLDLNDDDEGESGTAMEMVLL